MGENVAFDELEEKDKLNIEEIFRAKVMNQYHVHKDEVEINLSPGEGTSLLQVPGRWHNGRRSVMVVKVIIKPKEGRDVYVGEMRGSVLKELKKELQRKLKKEAIEVEETQHVVLDEKEALERERHEEEELRIEEERLAKIAKMNEKEKMEQCENEKGALTKKLQLKDHADLLSPEGTNWDDLDKLRGEINLFKTSCQDVSVEDLEIGLEKEKDKREEIKKQRDTATTTLDAAGGIDAIRNWLKSEDNTKFNDLKESAREKVKKKCENKLGKIKKIVDDVKTRIESLKKGGEPEADFWYEEALLETGQEPSIYCDREAATNFADYGKQLEKEQGTMQGVIKTRRQTKDEIIKAKKVEDMVVWLEKPYAEFTDLVEKAKDKKEELIKHWEEKANKALEAMDTPEKAESWLQNEDFLQFPELVTKAKHKQAKIALEEAESSDDRVG